MIKIASLLLWVSVLQSCASSTAKVREEAASQPLVSGSAAAKSTLGSIIESDTTLTGTEKQNLYALIDKAYQADDQFDALINQKKALLLTELLSSSPNPKKLSDIRHAIYKTQRERTNSFLSYIDQMCNTMRVHPSTASPMVREFMRGFAR